MTDWFRSWHGAPTDPKWLGIARKAGVAPAYVVAVAWALMDRASQASKRGSVDGYDADGLAAFLGCDTTEVDAIVSAMAEKGVLVDGCFMAWERRQPKREDDSSDRVREHRKRQADEAKRNVTQRNAPETEADTEKKIEPIAHSSEPRAMLLDHLCEAAGFKGNPPPWAVNFGIIAGMVSSGEYDLELDVLPVIRAKTKPDISSWNYYVKAIAQARRDRLNVPPAAKPVPIDWRARIEVYRRDKTWASSWGPPPGEPGCEAPAELLRTAA